MKDRNRHDDRQRLKVLIADDTPEVARCLAQLLSDDDNVSVIGPALDGSEALSLYNDHRPHVAVLDLHMPGLTGLMLLDLIRQRDSSILLIILTNEESVEMAKRCLAAGADFYLRKATEFERVLEIVGEQVDKRAWK